MCGLVGIAGNLLYHDEHAMKRLLMNDFFRGEHSTGLAAVRMTGEVFLSKIAADPIQLFGLKSFYTALNGNASRAFIGHNRHATRGKVETVNAHPFTFGKITGAHNGTLDYKSFRRLQEELGEEFAVDSMAIMAGIDKLGVEKTIGLCTEGRDSKEGAWALVWYDASDKSLNFLRNKHRPLWYCYEKDFKKLMWASEWWMLQATINEAVNKYELYTEKTKEGTVGYFQFEENVHYKFDLAKLCQGGTKRPKPVAKKVIPMAEEEANDVGPFDGNTMTFFRPAKDKDKTTCGTPTGSVGSHSSPRRTGGSTSPKVIILEGDELHPYANIIDEEKFTYINHTGSCHFCEEEISYGDQGITIFERDGRIICRDCAGVDPSMSNPPTKIYVRSSVIDNLS